MQCLDIVSFLVEALRKADEWGEKLFCCLYGTWQVRLTR